jgi:DNA-binding NarL/FixJ family response regulator
VDGDRKQVTICSGNDAFNAAVRLVLKDFNVHATAEPDRVTVMSDLLVWHFSGPVPVSSLAEVTSMVPTLVMAPEDQLLLAVDAGCRGFLPSSASLDDIHHAVTTVIAGGAVVPPGLLGTLLHHLVERRRRNQTGGAILDGLTERERQVFVLAADGLRKEDIGDRLYISPATARTHLQRIYKKLGLHSQSELMAMSMRVAASDHEET